MTSYAEIVDMYQAMVSRTQEERARAYARYVTDVSERSGTYGAFVRSETPMWQSQVVSYSGAITPDWIRQHFYKQEYDKVEPEIPDYMRVSEGL